MFSKTIKFVKKMSWECNHSRLALNYIVHWGWGEPSSGTLECTRMLGRVGGDPLNTGGYLSNLTFYIFQLYVSFLFRFRFLFSSRLRFVFVHFITYWHFLIIPFLHVAIC